MKFRLPQGEELDRISACGHCFDEIGDEAYAKVYSPFDEPIPVPPALEGQMEPIEGVIETVHERCIQPGEQVRERVSAR